MSLKFVQGFRSVVFGKRALTYLLGSGITTVALIYHTLPAHVNYAATMNTKKPDSTHVPTTTKTSVLEDTSTKPNVPISVHRSEPTSTSISFNPSFGTSAGALGFTPDATFLNANHTIENYHHLPIEHAILTTAPNVPPPIRRHHHALVKVDLQTTKKIAQLTNRFKYEQWTFNNTVPGPFIRARVGDVIELSLTNLDESGNPHNIDGHAFQGPGGGAAITTVEQNQIKTARFKLLYPGLFVYHCAAAPIPVHIMNGMYGLMYVQPEYDTLPTVDREYYVMQSEFYHEPPEQLEKGRFSDIVEGSYPNGLREEPDVIVFNGKESALTRDAPLTATSGETVRIFFGNAGPNLISSFHVIGSVFQRIYRDGDVVSAPGQFVSTAVVPPGGSTIVDMKLIVPGTYTLVDHAIFRLDKGAVGYLNVSGPTRPDIYAGAQPPAPCVGCKLHP